MGIISELRRRNVFRVAIAYVVVAWLVLQVGDTLAPALRLPDWINSALAFFLVLGFPLALVFAWAFELTPDGIKREKDVDRSDSITQQTGKKFNRVIIVVLVIAVAFFAFDKFVLDPSRDAELVQAATETTQVETAAASNSIAVLPFADLSPAGDQEYFSDGIAEEVLNVLVRVKDLNVASRTSSFGFKGQEALGIPSIAEKLKVRHVLEGSVRKAGDTVRITAQLIDAQTDVHLWSETYDRTLTAESIFSIQDEIAQAIVQQLGLVIEGRATPAAGTQNLDAYELYLRAHKVFIERSDILGAIELFEQTVAADPLFGRAVAGLAAAYVIAPSWEHYDRDYLALAEQAAKDAIEIDTSLAMAWAVLGYTHEEAMHYEDAMLYFDKAIESDPKETTAWLWRGILYNVLGYFDKAARDIDRCLELDPAYGNCLRHRARTALFSGDTDLALDLMERGLRIGFPGMPPMMLSAYAERGDHAAVLIAESWRMRELGMTPFIDYTYRAIVDPDFDYESERTEIEALYKATTGDELDWHSGPVALDAFTFGVYEALQPLLFTQYWWRPYPRDWWDSPHRKRLVREMRLPEYWRAHGFPAQCRPAGQDDFECDRPESGGPGPNESFHKGDSVTAPR
jgi:TolB-like protein